MSLKQNFDQNWIDAVIDRFFPVNSSNSGDIGDKTGASPESKSNSDESINS